MALVKVEDPKPNVRTRSLDIAFDDMDGGGSIRETTLCEAGR